MMIIYGKNIEKFTIISLSLSHTLTLFRLLFFLLSAFFSLGLSSCSRSVSRFPIPDSQNRKHDEESTETSVQFSEVYQLQFVSLVGISNAHVTKWHVYVVFLFRGLVHILRRSVWYELRSWPTMWNDVQHDKMCNTSACKMRVRLWSSLFMIFFFGFSLHRKMHFVLFISFHQIL